MHTKYEDFIAPYRKTEYKNVKENLSYSEHGFWITPEGNVYSLDRAMSHGRVAAAVYREFFDEVVKNSPNLYETSIATEIDLNTVQKHNWFRISTPAALNDINFSWGPQVTAKQIVALEIIVDTCDPEGTAEYWYDGGPGTLAELKAKIRETTKDTANDSS